MPLLSIIVPVFNEETNLPQVIERFMASPCPIQREWIFVDDCSRDRSLPILRSLASRYGFHVIEQRPNQGKGAAVICGIREATGEIIMIQDADFEYDPHDIPLLIQPILDGKADVVYGSRFKKTAPAVHRTYHYLANRFLTLLSNLLSGAYLTDMETCYKAFRADLAKAMNLRSHRFGIEVELTAYVAKTRARIYEVPISYFPRAHWEGKKITWKDGFAALYHLVRFNLFTTIGQAFHTVPHQYLSPPLKKGAFSAYIP